MKPKVGKVILVSVIALFLLGSELYAGSYCGDKEESKYPDKGKKFEKFNEELGLTPEQTEKLKEQRQEFSGKNKEVREKIRAKKEELKTELEKPVVNRAAVDNIINDVKNLTGEQLKSRVDKIMSMKSILTPEQFEKLQGKMREKNKKGAHGDKRKNKDHGYNH